jgi:tRNA(fMet)-specific endonuclease VapC
VILLKISLDSNTFGTLDFIDWLALKKEHLDVNISIIAVLEVYHWYNLRGLSKKELKLDLNSFNATINELQYNTIFKISENAKRGKLRFKHHARDYIIGTQAELEGTVLITYNLKHFEWLSEIQVVTPEEFIMMIGKD